MTGCFGLFWYLSPRNASRYSDPSVCGGSFIDEVRLLTAMKQYLKQLDSCFFPLAQVLHLTAERGRKHKRCENALLHEMQKTKKSSYCVTCWSLQCQLTDILDFSSAYRSTVDEDWRKDPTWGELHQKKRNALGLWCLQTLNVPACLHTFSGFTVRLVNPFQDFKRSTEPLTCLFTHAFTPCQQPVNST